MGAARRVGGSVKRLNGLDALRGVAALVVAFHHLSVISVSRGLGELPFLAVDLFFVISGFVMARTYEERLQTTLSTPRFILLRYKRLWLPLAIGTMLGMIALKVAHFP